MDGDPRLIDLQAKIHLQPWVTGTAWSAYHGVSPQTSDPYAVYRVLDRMARQEEQVQQWLVSQYLSASEADPALIFFYDLMSAYVDGTASPLGHGLGAGINEPGNDGRDPGNSQRLGLGS